MSTIPSALLRSASLPEERFASVAALAARIHELRGERPIVLKRGVVTLPGDAGRMCLVLRFAEAGESLGYAVIGDPPLAQGAQYDLLGGALAALCQDIAA